MARRLTCVADYGSYDRVVAGRAALSAVLRAAGAPQGGRSGLEGLLASLGTLGVFDIRQRVARRVIVDGPRNPAEHVIEEPAL